MGGQGRPAPGPARWGRAVAAPARARQAAIPGFSPSGRLRPERYHRLRCAGPFPATGAVPVAVPAAWFQRRLPLRLAVRQAGGGGVHCAGWLRAAGGAVGAVAVRRRPARLAVPGRAGRAAAHGASAAVAVGHGPAGLDGWRAASGWRPDARGTLAGLGHSLPGGRGSRGDGQDGSGGVRAGAGGGAR